MFIKIVLESLVHRNISRLIHRKYKLEYKTFNELTYCSDLSKVLQRNTCNPRPTSILKTRCIIHFVYVQKYFQYLRRTKIFSKKKVN